MIEFCGGSTCLARVQVWLVDPGDDHIIDPCQRCLDTLAAMFAVEAPGEPTFASVHEAIGGRL